MECKIKKYSIHTEFPVVKSVKKGSPVHLKR